MSLSICRKHCTTYRNTCPVCDIEAQLEAVETRNRELIDRATALEQDQRELVARIADLECQLAELKGADGG